MRQRFTCAVVPFRASPGKRRAIANGFAARSLFSRRRGEPDECEAGTLRSRLRFLLSGKILDELFVDFGEHDSEKRGRLVTHRLRQGDELNDVNTTFPTLDLGQIGLGLTKPVGDLLLGQRCFMARIGKIDNAFLRIKSQIISSDSSPRPRLLLPLSQSRYPSTHLLQMRFLP